MVDVGLVNRLVGLVFLLIGAALLYHSWQVHAALAPNVPNSVNDTPAARSLWLLGLGAVAALRGLFPLLQRQPTVDHYFQQS